MPSPETSRGFPAPQGSDHEPLQPSVMNPLQMTLIERSGLDPAVWATRYAARLRDLVEMSAHLRRLVVDDPSRALELIEKILAESRGDDSRRTH